MLRDEIQNNSRNKGLCSATNNLLLFSSSITNIEAHILWQYIRSNKPRFTLYQFIHRNGMWYKPYSTKSRLKWLNKHIAIAQTIENNIDKIRKFDDIDKIRKFDDIDKISNIKIKNLDQLFLHVINIVNCTNQKYICVIIQRLSYDKIIDSKLCTQALNELRRNKPSSQKFIFWYEHHSFNKVNTILGAWWNWSADSEEVIKHEKTTYLLKLLTLI